jgi:hypothetical protein
MDSSFRKFRLIVNRRRFNLSAIFLFRLDFASFCRPLTDQLLDKSRNQYDRFPSIFREFLQFFSFLYLQFTFPRYSPPFFLSFIFFSPAISRQHVLRPSLLSKPGRCPQKNFIKLRPFTNQAGLMDSESGTACLQAHSRISRK